jgi:hypothetical protein
MTVTPTRRASPEIRSRLLYFAELTAPKIRCGSVKPDASRMPLVWPFRGGISRSFTVSLGNSSARR